MDVAEVSGAAAVCVHVCRQVSLNQQLVLTFRLVDAACRLLAQVWLFSGGGGPISALSHGVKILISKSFFFMP